MSVKTFTKDPDAVLDYVGDWSKWLAGDTIVTSTWDIPAGIVKDSDDKTVTTVLIWLSGGTAGQKYACRNRITTALGRTDDRTIVIKIKEK